MECLNDSESLYLECLKKIEILYVVQSSAYSWNQKKDSLEYQGLYVMTLIASWVEIETIKVGSFFS